MRGGDARVGIRAAPNPSPTDTCCPAPGACSVATSASQEEALGTVLRALATIIAADPASYGDADARLRTAGALAAATIGLYWATSLRADVPALPAAEPLAAALSCVLQAYSKLPAYCKKEEPASGRPSFFDALTAGVASAVFAAAHSLASLLLEYGSGAQKSGLVWRQLVPACLRVIRQFGAMLIPAAPRRRRRRRSRCSHCADYDSQPCSQPQPDGLNDEYLLDPANFAFAQHAHSLLQLVAGQAERPALSLEDSVASLLEPADTVETMEACISFFHSATM